MGVQDFWVVIFVVGFCFRAQFLSSQNLTCNPNDLNALEGFTEGLKSIIGSWGKNFSSDCCNWAGITCNSATSLGLSNSIDENRVVELDLSSKRLIGNLSESLGNLEQLKVLNLSHNFLKYSLPVSLFQLPNLQVLDLSSNDFYGPIPADINLPSIHSLDISQNFLNGSIPHSICANSTQPRVLKLAVNYLSGNIPPGLGNCSSLEAIHLSTNSLSGGIPESIYQLHNLSRLSIQDNKLTGPLSKEIGNLLNLVRLDISINWFSGTIPDVFHSLGKLQYFVSHSNNFSGPIPPSLSSSPTIYMLNVRNNSLEGPIDLNCSAMTSLASLDLGSNRFYGLIPSNLPSCRHLNNINLARNNLSGPIPESFKNFHTLSYLSLSNSSQSNLSSALQILHQCQNLTTLVLTMNFYDEHFPADPTIHFARLKVLIIANCRLKGSIPQWLRNSRKLQLLDISWNCLEVQEPSPDFPLFMKKNVSARGLQYNQVWSFPPTLALGNNNLSGQIWPEFGNLKSLHVLDLKFNNLSGPIPSDLSGMTSLETLDLSHNKLSGSIPHTFVYLSFLSKFSVADNQLEGAIPSGGQFGTFPNSSFEGNCLCGERDPTCSSNSKTDGRPPLPRKSILELESKAFYVGLAVGFAFGVACFIVTDRYVWTWHL